MRVGPIRDADDLQNFMNRLGATSDRNRILALLLLLTGLRISDGLLLKVIDVQGEHINIKEKKTGKRIRRKINPRLRKELDTFTKGKHDDVYLFRSRLGRNQPLTRSGAYKIFRKAADELGLKHVGTHTMRKTFGYFLYQKEKNVAKLQKLLNHSKPEMTLLYIGITQEDLDQSIQDFDPFNQELEA